MRLYTCFDEFFGPILGQKINLAHLNVPILAVDVPF